MRIAVTGATGMVGTALSAALRESGHAVVPISRHQVPGGVTWNPGRREFDLEMLAGIDAVVHLAGESLAGGRWTHRRKERLRESRITTTRWFTECLAQLRPVPKVLVSASAIGVYGNRGDEILTESSTCGDDFLARLAAEWESAADPARQAGIRVVHPRFGLILSGDDGALRPLLRVFRLGLGGRFGNGRQWMSWITIDDVVGAIQHALRNDSVVGPVNFVAAAPIQNAEFTRALGRAVRRPALLPVPAVALRLAFGEMADCTILASQRVLPVRLRESGYVPRFPEIDDALAHVVNRT
jgi:uncharacterized protein (TIGR01777 family)